MPFLVVSAALAAASAFFTAAATFRSVSFASDFKLTTSFSSDYSMSKPEWHARNLMCSDAIAG